MNIYKSSKFFFFFMSIIKSGWEVNMKSFCESLKLTRYPLKIECYNHKKYYVSVMV